MTCGYCLKEIGGGITLQDKEKGILNFYNLAHVNKYYDIEEGSLKTICGETVLFEESCGLVNKTNDWFSDMNSFLESYGYELNDRKE